MYAHLQLFAASVAFEFAYVAWARAASRSHGAQTVAWSVITAGLGLLGIKGALELDCGVIAYLGGVGLGASISAWLGHRQASVT